MNEIPLEKILNYKGNRYELARACMEYVRCVRYLNKDDEQTHQRKEALIAIEHILDKNISYTADKFQIEIYQDEIKFMRNAQATDDKPVETADTNASETEAADSVPTNIAATKSIAADNLAKPTEAPTTTAATKNIATDNLAKSTEAPTTTAATKNIATDNLVKPTEAPTTTAATKSIATDNLAKSTEAPTTTAATADSAPTNTAATKNIAADNLAKSTEAAKLSS